MTQENIVHKKWDGCLIVKALYRYKPGGDDWRSWILNTLTFSAFCLEYIVNTAENGQITIKKKHWTDESPLRGWNIADTA